MASEKGPGSGQRDVPAAPLRVGACLAPHWRRWQAIGAESLVVSVLRDGYRVLFLGSSSPCPLCGIVPDVSVGISSVSSPPSSVLCHSGGACVLQG